jgi:hypothetical protein
MIDAGDRPWLSRLRSRSTIQSMMIRYLAVAVLCVTCVGERDDGRSGNEANGTPHSGDSRVEFEVRLHRGTVERGAFVGTSHLLIHLDNDGAYLYHRADGNRIALDVRPSATRWRPNITWLAPLSDDRVAVYDHHNRLLTQFDTSGAMVRATSLEAPGVFPSPVAAFADGGLLVLRDYLPHAFVQETGAYADTTALLPVTSELQARGPEIPVTRSRRFAALADPEPGDVVSAARTVGVVNQGAFDGRGRYSVEALLSPRTHVAGTRNHAYVGSSDAAVIRVLAPDGTERGRFRILEEGRSLDAAMRTRVREEKLRDAEPRFRELYEGLTVPDHTPRYGRLLGDTEGRLWVERYALPDDVEAEWTVYQQDGTRAGSLALPAGVRLLDATGQHVLLARPGVLGTTRLQVVPYTLN